MLYCSNDDTTCHHTQAPQSRFAAHVWTLRVLPVLAGTLVALGGCGNKTRKSTATKGDRGSSSVKRIRATALHAAHANAAKPVACEGCHEKLAGQYLPAKSWRCTNCHKNERLALHAAASEASGARECFSCHDFTATKIKSTACISCHAKQRGTVRAITPHDPKHPQEDCTGCHRAHKTPSLVRKKCESCHDKEVVTGHAKPGIQIRGCASCHGYHEKASVASTRCTNCHRQSRQLVSKHATFTKGKQGKGHVKCVTCHREHHFFKTEVIGCRAQCHQNVVAIAEDKVEKHRGCIGCHDKHDVLGSPAKSCVTCHEVVPNHPKDPKSHTRCIGCHPPHAGRGAPLAVSCTSCHKKKASSDRGLHQSYKHRGPSCRNCHKPHAFALSSARPSLCRSCHGEKPFPNAPVIRTYVKHSNCIKCHTAKVAHKPSGPKVACGSCHMDKAAVAFRDHKYCTNCHDPHTTKQQRPCGSCHKKQARIARGQHRKCRNCHEPHSTHQRKPCSGCHPTEARTAPLKHKQCQNCHDKHSTVVKRPCGSCHKSRTTGIHRNVPGSCMSCHRPHGPKGHAQKPACRSCHNKPLPALHASSGHRKCTKCHRSHGGQPYRSPATCRGCHTDRKNHEPAATSCIGCHSFGGTK